MLQPGNNTKSHLKKTTLACAMASILGSGTMMNTVQADEIQATIEGVFTLIGPGGSPTANTDNVIAPWFGNRTPVVGTLVFDTEDSANNSMDIDPFSFFGGGSATATNITFQTIGDGFGDPSGSLLLGNMGFNWNGTFGIGVSLAWDAQGLLDAVNAGVKTGDTITGGALAATDGQIFGSKTTYTLPIGPSPIVSTTFNTTTITNTSGTTPLGTNPSGSLPLIADTLNIGSSPMPNGPFADNNANFDFTSLTVTSFTDTTPPVVDISPSTVAINVGDTFDPLAPTGVTINVTDAGDSVLGNPALTTADCTIDDPVNTSIPGSYTVTYTCADGSGNVNVAPLPSLVVTVSAAGQPVIAYAGPTTVDHEAGTAFTEANVNATCTDSDGVTAITGAGFTLDTTLLDVNSVGVQSVTWNCTGTSGTASLPLDVNVQDTLAPVITLSTSCPITVEADGSDPTPTATAEDPNFLTDLTADIVNTGTPVDPAAIFGSNLSFTYNLGYEVSDANGNQAVEACQIILGNPDPVATLNGSTRVPVNFPDGIPYVEMGATCNDFKDGSLPDASIAIESTDSAGNAVSVAAIDANSPNGSYTVTYTCTDNDGNTAQAQRFVAVGIAYQAQPVTSGSNFIMIVPTGRSLTGSIQTDITATWDGTLITPATFNTSMSNANLDNEENFFGFPWTAHDMKVVGPGRYEIDPCPEPIIASGPNEGLAADGSKNCLDSNGVKRNPMIIEVGPNQIGAHILFDWNGNDNIDLGLVWDVNGAFEPPQAILSTVLQSLDSLSYNLAVSDSDGDGIPGQGFVDGPFFGQNPSFNMNFDPAFALPDASANASQGANTSTSIIAQTNDAVVVTATVNPDTNSVPYAGPFTYDWSDSDPALLSANSNGTTSQTFEFNPSGLSVGATTAVVKATDSPTGLTSIVTVPLQVVNAALSDPSVVDDDADGIPNAFDDAGLSSRQIQTAALNQTSFLMEVSAGNLVLGDIARQSSAGSSSYQAGITDTVLPADDAVAGSCVGGCVDYKVTGLTSGDTVDVVIPLSEAIPAGASFRKLINNQWRDYNETNGNSLASAIGTPGICPAASDSSWTSGLTEGDLCVKLSIVDGGTNDADGIANGTIVDPGGVAGASTNVFVAPGTTRDPNIGGGGCSINTTQQGKLSADWWLFGGFIALLGLVRRKLNQS